MATRKATKKASKSKAPAFRQTREGCETRAPAAKHKPAPPAARKPAATPAKAPASTPSQQPTRGVPAGTPIFAEPNATADPTKYTTPHASDAAAYNEMAALIKASKFLPLPFPAVAGVAEPVLTLADSLGPSGPSAVAAIQAAGQIVFHCAGDTGATQGPKTENEGVDKMLADFTGEAASAVPRFFYNLGDIVYSFGEHKYYYDQFYDAYRDYPAPIFAVPGNHDGIVLPPPAEHLEMLPPRSPLSWPTSARPPLPTPPDAVGLLAHHHDRARRLLHPRLPAGPHPRHLLQYPGEPRRHLLHARSHHRQAHLPAALRRAAHLPHRRALTRVKTDKFAGAVLLIGRGIIRLTPLASTPARSPCSRRLTPVRRCQYRACGRTPSSPATRTTTSATPAQSAAARSRTSSSATAATASPRFPGPRSPTADPAGHGHLRPARSQGHRHPREL